MPANARKRGLLLQNGLVQVAPPTPAPTWKLYENPSFYTVAAVAMASTTGLMECEEEEEEEEEDTGRHQPYASFVSARKLAASLQDEFRGECHCNLPVRRSKFPETSPSSHLQQRPLSFSNSGSPDSVDHHSTSKGSTGSRELLESSRPLSSPSTPLKALTPTSGSSNSWIAAKAADLCPSPSGRDSVQELGDFLDNRKNPDAGLTASPRGYINAFTRFSLESPEQDSSLVESTYSEEVQWAISRVRQVEAAQISAREDIGILLRRCADEVTMLREKEQERVQAAILSIAEELEVEREARKNAEMEGKRLANCMADANKAVLAAKKDLEKERKSRQLLEDVCNELAKEIGEDKTEVEEIKKELAKARDEIEEERKVIHMTDAWREERVQMKLAEAKFELEERCIALDRLKMDVQSFLSKQRVHRAGRRGKRLERAINRLQEETSKTAFFQEDARFQLLPDDDFLSSNISSSQLHTLHNNTTHVYNRKYKKQTVFSAEHNGSDLDIMEDFSGCMRETCNQLELTNAQLNEQRCGHMQAFSRRRNKASIRSYGSKTKELTSLDHRDYTEDSTNDVSTNRCVENSRSEGDSPRDCKFDEQDEDFGTQQQGHRKIVLWSINGQEQLESSSHMVEQICNMKGRRGASRTKQQLFCGQGYAGAERHYYRDFHSNHVSSQGKESILATQNVDELLLVEGPSPASKCPMPSPKPLMGNFYIMSPSIHSISVGRRAVYSYNNQSKPYKKNSLDKAITRR